MKPGDAARILGAASSLFIAKSQRVFYPEDFGAQGGATDDTTAMQNCWNAAASVGGTVVVRQPHLIGGQLNVVSGLRIYLNAAAYLIRTFSGHLIGQTDYSTPLEDIWITGPGRVGAQDQTTTSGHLIALRCDDLRIDFITVDTWGGGVAYLLAGDRMRMTRPRSRNPYQHTGVGGLRICGGNDQEVHGADIYSGDDCMQFVPLPASTSGDVAAMANLSISNGRYIGGSGVSYAARVCAAVIADTPLTGAATMTDSITDCSFSGVRGQYGAFGIQVANKSSVGAVKNITIEDCSIIPNPAAVGTPAVGLHIQQGLGSVTGVGSVEGVSIVDCSVTPVEQGLLAQPNDIGKIRNVHLERGHFYAPTDSAAVATLDMSGIDKWSIDGTTLHGMPGSGSAIQSGTTSAKPSSHGRLRDPVFVDMPDNAGAVFSAVRFNYATDMLLDGGVFKQVAAGLGGGGAFLNPPIAWSTTSNTSGVKVKHNDYTGLASSLVGTTAVFSDAAPDTIIQHNTGDGGVSTLPAQVGSVLAAVMTADDSPVNNSTTLVTSTVLKVALPANTTWTFDLRLFYDCSQAADLIFGWVRPTGATGSWAALGPQVGTTSNIATTVFTEQSISSTSAVGGVAVGTQSVARPTGVIVVGSTGGTFALKYAQNTADATNLTVRAPSSLTCTRIA